MICYACDQAAVHRCPRCAKPYCADHGEVFCNACLDPASAAPSSTVFRGSLLALLIGSVLALWLLIRPPSLPGESEVGVVVPRSPEPMTPAVTVVPSTPSPATTVSPTPPQATPTPKAKPTPTPSPTPAFVEYTVQEGDTLSSIAAAYGVTVEEIIAANDIANPDEIAIGDVLIIPQ